MLPPISSTIAWGGINRQWYNGTSKTPNKALKRRCDANKVATELVKTAFEKGRAEAVAAKGKKAKAKALSAKVASASAPLKEELDRWWASQPGLALITLGSLVAGWVNAGDAG